MRRGVEGQLGLPRAPNNSGLPPSRGGKPSRDNKSWSQGNSRMLVEAPDKTVTAHPSRYEHCQAALDEADQILTGRFNKVDLRQLPR